MPTQRMRKSLRGLILRRIIGRISRRVRLYTQTPTGRARGARRVFGAQRSVYVRHLDCGSCNGCEVELSALENPVYDFGHLGFEFKASPRHADILVLTGPYTRNLDEAARRTFAAMPSPQRIVAIGDCAVAPDDPGRCVYVGSYALTQRPSEIENAIVERVEGCPPTPEQIIEKLIKVQDLTRQDGLRSALTKAVQKYAQRIPWRKRTTSSQ
jgi:Ni,Fe-hydrogenase III small subunit